MILTAFTIFHVILSLIGIVAGLVVLYGFLTSQSLISWTTVFLAATVATSVTGFFFPFHGLTPGIVVGILSLIVLALAIRARNRWRRTYVITSIIALYLNVFVLVVQLFEKVPALTALAPTQSEPPFQIAQAAVLLIFVFLAIRATMKFHP
ncbi:MAG: hypothetical protein ABSF22_05395 [Bryobacteraceae bacterium]